MNEAWLEESWKDVAPDIFSGEHAIDFYGQFSGKVFPHEYRETFLKTVNRANKAYLMTQRIPGAAKAQEFLGKSSKKALDIGKAGLVGAGALAVKGLSNLKGRWELKK